MRKGQEGFGLLEILIASVVLGVMTTSVCYFLSSQNRVGARSSESLRSLNLGKHKMDSLKVADYGGMQSGSDTVDQKFIRAWYVSPTTDGAGLPRGCKKIELTVFWPLSAEHRLTFTSLLSDGKYKEKQ